MEKEFVGSGGIRTHASEETGALNQRLRPLGHATLGKRQPYPDIEMHPNSEYLKIWPVGGSNP